MKENNGALWRKKKKKWRSGVISAGLGQPRQASAKIWRAHGQYQRRKKHGNVYLVRQWQYNVAKKYQPKAGWANESGQRSSVSGGDDR